MFLVDSALAAADWDDTVGVIENILKRADAEVVALRKWGERRLAYDIAHKSRGTYILTYFKADPQRVAGVEKDVQLSEKVMRVLVLGTEKRPADVLEADITGVSKEEAEAESSKQTEATRADAAEKASAEEKPAAEAQATAAGQSRGDDAPPSPAKEAAAHASATEAAAKEPESSTGQPAAETASEAPAVESDEGEKSA
jgi:small subunit ribosomal protein S6